MVPPEALDALNEGVRLCLARWTALQLAVQNEWGGRQSSQKAQQFQADIVAWFVSCKESPYIDDLEELLDENMLLSFNTEIEDGSLEEVAEELMLLHEECLQGNFERLQKLHATNSSGMKAIAESQNDGGSDEDDGSDLEETNMDTSASEVEETNMDASASEVDLRNMDVISKHSADASMTEDIPSNDGWQVVGNRRRQGRQGRD